MVTGERKKWEVSENLVPYRGRYSDFLYCNAETKGNRREMIKRRPSCSTEEREVERQSIACDLCASVSHALELGDRVLVTPVHCLRSVSHALELRDRVLVGTQTIW